MSVQLVHTTTVTIPAGDVEISHSACRTLPTDADASSCVRPLPVCPAGGQYRSVLGPILAMAERRLACLEPGIGPIAEAIVRQQGAQREARR